jgi:hypothetical protein
VESVHAFVHGPVFWWLISILWTIVVGRQLDPELGDQVIGYRLARKFVSDHERHGVMFQEPTAAYDRWNGSAGYRSQPRRRDAQRDDA